MINISNGFVNDFITKAKLTPDKIFASFNGQPISFQLIDQHSATIAAELRQRGISTGDRVAVIMRNNAHSLAILFGIARAGAVWIPINVELKSEGLKYILDHSKPNLIFSDIAYINMLETVCPEKLKNSIITSGNGNCINSLELLLLNSKSFLDSPPEGSDLFSIMYTSGTTGKPKGVLVTHGMLRLAGESVKYLTQLSKGDIFFVWEPLFHIGGAQLIILPVIEDLMLAMVERFSARSFWEQVRKCKATHIHYLGGILQILLKQPADENDKCHSVRIAWGGGCPKDVWHQFKSRFGVEIRECYGMTEASSITTANLQGVIGSVGRAMPWFSLTIEDENQNPLPFGERGEIVIRSSLEGALFSGYFNNTEATSKTLVNGALRTGDSGTLDPSGHLWFHGRMTDSVRCKGENVSAWEVEHVACNHPSVEDCAMIGVLAEIGEQEIKLFVKPKSGLFIDPTELSEWLSERLARYQNPRYIEIVTDFERTPSQRIIKHVLSRNITGCWDRLHNQ